MFEEVFGNVEVMGAWLQFLPLALAGAGKLFGGASKQSAANRGAQTAAELEAEQIYQQALLAREREARASQADAIRNRQTATMLGSFDPQAGAHLGRESLDVLSRGGRMAEELKRYQAPKAGWLEKYGGWLGGAMGLAGSVADARKGNSGGGSGRPGGSGVGRF